MNRKWRFYKLTNLTVFAALLNDVPMGCCLRVEEDTRQPYNKNLCLLRAPALLLHGMLRLEEEEESRLFNIFINKRDGFSADQFQGVHMNDIIFVEDLLTLNILLCDIDITDGDIMGEPARRSMQKYDNTVRLLRCNDHVCYVRKINSVFQSFRCPNCDTFFTRTFNLERHLATCSE